MTVERRKVDQVGQLAIEPVALTLMFAGAIEAEPFKLDGPNAIVDISGPLEARGDACFFDTYEAVTKRVNAACASPAATIVLRINSPGGAVSGCFAAARAIRRAAKTSGKRLVAYVDECAVSAAYALASAAELIALPPTGRVGSIGVIEVLPSFARQDQAAGVDVSVITSGARKGDGHPALPMTDDARAALQLGVDRMAEAFFDLVAEHRGRPAGEFASLQAAVYYGQDAVTIGLADQVSDFDGFMAALAAPQPTGATQVTKAELMAALQAMAEDDKCDDAPMAKRMLAAAEPPKPADDGEEDSGDADASAAAVEDPMKKEEPSASVAALASTVNAMAAQLAAIDAEKRAKLEADRAAAFAARPDVSEVLQKALASAPLADVQAALAAIPAPSAAAAATVQGARGAGEGGASVEGVSYLSDQAAELDRKMGLVPEGRAVVTEGTKTYFGVAVAAPKKGS